MKTAGIREARHHLSDLLNEVREGREVLITEHGRPVARLVPPHLWRPFPDRTAMLRRNAPLARRLAQAGVVLSEGLDREDRV